MKFDRFDYTVWSVLGALALALTALFGFSSLVGVRVVETVPEPDGQTSALQRIGITFDSPMQAGSVQVTLEPAVTGTLFVGDAQAWFSAALPLEPGQTYTATVSAGAESESGRRLKSEYTWSFTVRAPALVYIAPATGGPSEIWRSNQDGTGAMALTETGGKVFDLGVARDGHAIVYSAINDQDGMDLWLLDVPLGTELAPPARLLVDCGPDRCTAPAWSPDGTRLAFSREETGLAPGAPPGPPRVWTVSVDSGQAAALYVDSQVLGYGPTWSPDGQRLAFFDGSVGGIRVVEVATSDEMVLPSWIGQVGSFAPDGQQMFFNDVRLAAEQVVSVLYLADFESREVTVPFSDGVPWSDYGAPAWSPDGEWLAVSLRDSTNTPGRQLWLMHPDGSDARAITSEPAFAHGSYRWDPWSRRLIIQRVSLTTPFPKPEIVVWNLETSQTQVVAVDATLAHWLP